MKKNVLKIKSHEFAILIVKLSQKFQMQRKEYVLSKQLLRSGTAIGALIGEAEFAKSKKDFIRKMSISLKEANETSYWLDILKNTGYLIVVECDKLCSIYRKLLAMLVSTIRTTKLNVEI